MRQNHRWTDDERDIIRQNYKHSRESVLILARRLGVPEYGVKAQVQSMGLGKSDDRRQWTPQEKEKLVELIPRYCPRRVAKIMHRSLNSVVVMSKRLKASRRYRDGWFTKREVCEILGHGHKWVQARIDCGALIASYHYDQRPQKLGGSAWHIESKDLTVFIRRYPEELVGVNLDIIMIVELLAGIKNNQ